VLRVKEKDDSPIIDPNLLSILLRSDFCFGQITHLVTGIGRPRISSKAVRDIKIPIPFPMEQQRIIRDYNAKIKLAEQLHEQANNLIKQTVEIRRDAILLASENCINDREAP
jgi:restriction endonuclease S subunit